MTLKLISIRSLAQEREQQEEIRAVEQDVEELRGVLMPLEDLVRILSRALEERDEQERSKHATDIAALLAQNEEMQAEIARLAERVASEQRLVCRLQHASLHAMAEQHTEEAEKLASGGSSDWQDAGGVKEERVWSDVCGEEDVLRRQQLVSASTVSCLHYFNSGLYLCVCTCVCARKGLSAGEYPH